MFPVPAFFVILKLVRKNGTTNNEKLPLTLARTVFSERRSKRSSFLSNGSSRFEDALLLERSARLLERLSLLLVLVFLRGLVLESSPACLFLTDITSFHYTS